MLKAFEKKEVKTRDGYELGKLKFVKFGGLWDLTNYDSP